MSAAGGTWVFVSHSHHDNTFGLRLIADLRAHLGDDAVWFDASGGLQGGDDWWRKIVEQILARDAFLVILSPDALASPWVRKEMDLAYNQHVTRAKPLLPVLYRACEPPVDWQLIQMIAIDEPQRDVAAYEHGLEDILRALGAGANMPSAKPALGQEDLYHLYKAGLQARNAQRWEESADAWRKVLASDPNYLGGALASDFKDVESEVAALNVKRLRQAVQDARAGGDTTAIVRALYALTLADPHDQSAQDALKKACAAQANQEHQRGAWDDEMATWDLLVRIVPTFSYASQRKQVAEQNRQYAQMYRLATELLQEGKRAEASEQLTKLWSYAPYYGDPAGVAPTVGLTVPPSYDDAMAAKEHRRAELLRSLRMLDHEIASVPRVVMVRGLRYSPMSGQLVAQTMLRKPEA